MKNKRLLLTASETHERLLEKYQTCQVVHGGVKCRNRATDLHHCLISRNKRFGDWINAQIWNYQPACANCNRFTRDADRNENRMAWLEHQIAIYGEEYLLVKMGDAPDKLKQFNQDYNQVYTEVQMRYAARTDANQREIVDALRGVGASVFVTHRVGNGFPDIIVGYKGVNYLLEIKDGEKPDSATKLTPDEQAFFEEWGGQAVVIYSVEDALISIGAI